MADDEQLPKQELLIKLMGMTGSSNDGEALVALRKATELLKSAGWDWRRLIEGKIKVVESPFKAGVKNPFERVQATPPQAAAASTWKPQPAPPPKPKPKTAPNFFASPTSPISLNPNRFANFCYCCGLDVPAQQGFVFDPWTKCSDATSKWQVVCKSCNTSGVVTKFPATPIRNSRKASVTDLA